MKTYSSSFYMRTNLVTETGLTVGCEVPVPRLPGLLRRLLQLGRRLVRQPELLTDAHNRPAGQRLECN